MYESAIGTAHDLYDEYLVETNQTTNDSSTTRTNDMSTKSWNDIKLRRPTCSKPRDTAHLENLAEDLGLPLAELRRFVDLTQVELAATSRHAAIGVRDRTK